jgi:hypothetical protein
VAVLPFASESADAEMELLNRRIIERRGRLEYGFWLTTLFSTSGGRIWILGG